MPCIAVDPFGIEGELPSSVATGIDRREELLASQSLGVLDAHRRIDELRRVLLQGIGRVA